MRALSLEKQPGSYYVPAPGRTPAIRERAIMNGAVIMGSVRMHYRAPSR
jgi:hypothetical protein